MKYTTYVNNRDQKKYAVRLSGKIFFDSGTDLGFFDSITHNSGHDLTTYKKKKRPTII